MNCRVLVVEDDAGLREALVDTLTLGGYNVAEAENGEAALLVLARQHIDLVVTDVQMPGMDGLTLLRNIKAKYRQMPVLMMTAFATINSAVQAIQEGAEDYMAKPFAPEVLLNLVSRFAPSEQISDKQPIVADERSQELLRVAAKVAATDASVMVSGPSGAGKEVLAHYIHHQSTRKDKPFVAINCAAIPDNMLEATLFGYEKGAFTGAINACPGKFEQAQGGTILLDEITEMDLGLQAKLLRVLQEREVERLGSRKTIKLDVRVVATSNRDLREAVQKNDFREDLYYRLNVFPLKWLPLAQRQDDIIPLAEHLLKKHADINQSATPTLTAAARSKLLNHGWPGNVRELENVIQRAMILKEGDVIDSPALLIEEFSDMMPTQPVVAEAKEDKLGSELRIQENQIIIDTLSACNGKRKLVAEKLGISPRTLRYKLARMREDGVAIPV